MNRTNLVIVTALGAALIASACTTYEVYQMPAPAQGSFGYRPTQSQGPAVVSPAPTQGHVASPVAGRPTQGGSPSAPERYELPQTRELKQDGPIISTLTPLPTGVAGTFSKDPATGRVTEYVGSRPNEQEAQCIRHNPATGAEECLLGVRNGNMCTPHMPARACVNRAPQ